MNINTLKSRLDRISEVRVVDKDFELDGIIYNFIGFVRNADILSAAVFSYSEELRELRDEMEICGHPENHENLTVREEKKLNERCDGKFIELSSVSVDGIEFKSFGSSRSLLNDDKHTALLIEFLKNGWQAENIGHINLDYCYLSIYKFEGEFSEIPKLNYSDIKLSFRPMHYVSFEEKPIKLEAGNCDKEITLSDGNSIYIRNVELKDMEAEFESLFSNEQFKERFSAEEIEAQRTKFINDYREYCPEGKRLLIVEYEAPPETNAVIELKSCLDSLPVRKSSCMGFICKSDLKPIHGKTAMKSHVLDSFFDPDEKLFDAEIFSVGKHTKPDDMSI